MTLSVLDPSLLVYDHADWQAKAPHCMQRFKALLLHNQITRRYGFKIAMSNELESLVHESFPYGQEYRNIAELRDLRQLMLQMLSSRSISRMDTNTLVEVNLEPEGAVGQEIDAPQVIEYWNDLLGHCLTQTASLGDVPQIATWRSDTSEEREEPLIRAVCEILEERESREYEVPLVWDDDSWAAQLVIRQWWPDLQRCVELHYKGNPGIRTYDRVREEPIPFTCTRAFGKSLEQFCEQADLRRELIEAITKRVYGVLDARLGDEAFKDMRRFRVTKFWRVHYHLDGDQLVLDEFGPHAIGGAD